MADKLDAAFADLLAASPAAPQPKSGATSSVEVLRASARAYASALRRRARRRRAAASRGPGAPAPSCPSGTLQPPARPPWPLLCGGELKFVRYGGAAPGRSADTEPPLLGGTPVIACQKLEAPTVVRWLDEATGPRGR